MLLSEIAKKRSKGFGPLIESALIFAIFFIQINLSKVKAKLLDVYTQRGVNRFDLKKSSEVMPQQTRPNLPRDISVLNSLALVPKIFYLQEWLQEA